MDVMSIASAFLGAQAAQTQMTVAAKMLKMNLDQQASVVQLLDAGQQNLSKLANVASGVGTQLDVTA